MTKNKDPVSAFWNDPAQIHAAVKWSLSNVIAGNVLSSRKDLEIYKPKKPKDLGMSGVCTRKFLNVMCSVLGTSYLEVGLAGGSTFCAATAENTFEENQFVGIEAWNEKHFRSSEEIKNNFFSNFKKYVGREVNEVSNAEIIQDNFFNLTISEVFSKKNLKPVNFYFYDADHSENATWWALAKAYPILADIFVYAVDDWGDDNVRMGAYKSIKSLGFNIHGHYQLLGTAGDALLDKEGKRLYKHLDPEEDFADYYGWYNGLGVFILEKNAKSFFEMAGTRDLGQNAAFCQSERGQGLQANLDADIPYLPDPLLETQSVVLDPPGNLKDLQW